MLTDPYGDEQLVELYDGDNEPRDDHAYYRALADRVAAATAADRGGATTIVDLGCGTGLLTRALAAVPGRRVIGVDPSPTMLGFARRQPGADAVTWIDGDASALAADGQADLVISSGNAMMHVEDLPATLTRLAAALRPGGVISFESRNPAVRAWEQWTTGVTERETPFGPLREWMEVTAVDQGRVTFDAYNVFEDGRQEVYTSVLFFRDAEQLAGALEASGFGEIELLGGWHDEPLTAESRLIVVRARTEPR
ncbi:class I SAM-dependent methyltransferase [Kribbella italica]|uniref:SAM-dependent methyltransferase n=1 Tax=Kribbella italica TaxID=1540520 RepID=A0A7W9J817_9ACTN|nr:class I SAM-dependent methyltransferase [Kribbella italica]MBB5836802.1 SAM-dependent methyltransferase [Kribbella italica]